MTAVNLQNLVVDSVAAVSGGALTLQIPAGLPVIATDNGPTASDAQVGAAAAAVTATLPAVTGKTARIMGFDVTGGVVLIALLAGITVGALVNNKTFTYNLVLTVTGGAMLAVRYDKPVPANAVNQAISVTVPALVGGPAIAVNVWGDYV
jgi:hypothetical protein